MLEFYYPDDVVQVVYQFIYQYQKWEPARGGGVQLYRYRFLKETVSRDFLFTFFASNSFSWPHQRLPGAYFNFFTNLRRYLKFFQLSVVYDTPRNGDLAVYHTLWNVALAVKDTPPNCSIFFYNSPVIHCGIYNAALYYSLRNVDSAVYHTLRNGDSSVYHTYTAEWQIGGISHR